MTDHNYCLDHSTTLRTKLFELSLTILVYVFSKNGVNGRQVDHHSSNLFPPVFIQEPPTKVVFYNSSGTVVPCKANGRPEPSIFWTLADRINDREPLLVGKTLATTMSNLNSGRNSMIRNNKQQQQQQHFQSSIKYSATYPLLPLADIDGLRYVRTDGSLVFPPFGSNQFRPEIHSRTYQCVASNSLGTIVSRNVQISAVLEQPFEVRVYDEFVTKGSTGILRCQVPAYLNEVVSVDSWIRNDGLIIKSRSTSNPKYTAFPSGELHMTNVQPGDGQLMHRCQVVDNLTGRSAVSTSYGRLVVMDSEEPIPPRFTHTERLVKVKQGEKVMLPCATQGYPRVSTKWFKQERNDRNTIVPIVDFTSSGLSSSSIETLRQFEVRPDGTLVINEARREDAGTYLCTVNNKVGEEKGGTHLIISAPLKASLKPMEKTITVGSSVTLNCSTYGYPIVDVAWLKDGHHLDTRDGSKYKRLFRDVLLVQSIGTEDDGIYQCLVYNDEDSSQASILLKISSDPPTLIIKPSNRTVDPDTPVSLKCSARGNPLPQITWTSYDEPIVDTSSFRVGDYVSSDGAVVSFINISRISVGQGGKYECHATNDFGRASYSVWLTVIGPPFIKHMRNVTVVAGSVLVIHCPVSVYLLASILWYKDSKGLPLNRRQTVFTNGTLVIEKVFREEDEGGYKCVARNTEGEYAEQSVHVKVLVAPTIMPFNFPQNLQEGQRASITCTVTTGDPPVTISWYRDGERLATGAGLHLENVDDFISNLYFKPLKEEHSGVYACVATNLAASVNHTAYLSVDAPPKWQISPSDTSAVVGQSLTIDCQAKGKPEPRVLWKKMTDSAPSGGYKTVISGSRVQTLANGSLHFTDLTATDTGNYMCEASNGVGSPLSIVLKLTVNVPAHFLERYTSVKATKGDQVTLSCTAYGEDPLRIVWSKESLTLEKSINQYHLTDEARPKQITSKLLIPMATRTHSGLYTCTGSNAFGKGEQHIEVTVEGTPDVPDGLKVIKLTSRSFHLVWKEPFNGNSPIKNYVLQMKELKDPWGQKTVQEILVEGSRTEVFIRGLTPNTVYKLRIRAENGIGSSEWTEEMSLTTEDEVPEAAPSNVHVTPLGSKALNVSWQVSLSTKSRTVNIHGFYVGYKRHNAGESYIFKTVSSDTGQSNTLANGSNIFWTELFGLSKSTKYLIVVQAYNSKGAGPLSDEILTETAEFDVPSPPIIRLPLKVTSTSVEISWTPAPDEDNPILGYVIKFRKEDEEEWRESQVMSVSSRGSTLNSLTCGTLYHFSILALNSVGRGSPSDIVSVKTKGSPPSAPKKEDLVSANSTYFLVFLVSWTAEDCPIDYFSVRYKPTTGHSFISVQGEPYILERTVIIRDLAPATWYTLWVSAKNGAGVTEAQYKVATLTESGEYLHQHEEETSESQLASILGALFGLAGVLLLIVLLASIIVCCHQTKSRSKTNMQYPFSEMDGEQKDSMQMNNIGVEKLNFCEEPPPTQQHQQQTSSSSTKCLNLQQEIQQHHHNNQQQQHQHYGLRECVVCPYGETRLPPNTLKTPNSTEKKFFLHQSGVSSNLYDVPQIRQSVKREETLVSFLNHNPGKSFDQEIDDQTSSVQSSQAPSSLCNFNAYGHILYQGSSCSSALTDDHRIIYGARAKVNSLGAATAALFPAEALLK